MNKVFRGSVGLAFHKSSRRGKERENGIELAMSFFGNQAGTLRCRGQLARQTGSVPGGPQEFFDGAARDALL